jgi:hypothetical protein
MMVKFGFHGGSVSDDGKNLVFMVEVSQMMVKI